LEEGLVEEGFAKGIVFAREEIFKEIMKYFVVFSSGA